VDEEYTVGGFQVRTGYALHGASKRPIKIIVPNHRNNDMIVSLLDVAKVADVLLCVFPSHATYENSSFDEQGYRTLTALRMQGLPPLVLGTVAEVGETKLGMKTVQRYFFSEFSEDKSKFVIPSANVRIGDTASLGKQVMTSILSSFNGNLSANVSESLSLRRQRGYMFVDRIEAGEEMIAVSGFSRGAGFSLKNPVLLTGISCPFIVRKMEITGKNDMGEVLEMTEAERLEIRDTLSPLRPAEIQEQTWPSAEEEAEADRAIFEQRMKRVVVPHGIAGDSMEAAWLAEDMPTELEFPADEDEAILSGMFDWNKVPPTEESNGIVVGSKSPEFESRTRDEMDFVDEVDTPQNIPARERFQRYRGLKSLRNANWDPYEELPAEYSQIHEFQDIAFTAKQGFESISQNGVSNKQIVMFLEPVIPEEHAASATMNAIRESLSGMTSIVASTMAINESKVTVVHCRVQRLPEMVDREIKSKDTMIVQCGFRRIEVRPIFSDIPKYSSSTGTCPIQRMHRRLPQDTQSSILMSFYAPAIFGSNPVLVFDPKDNGLLMWGSVGGCAPNKPVIVKRITLTGYPFRVHQTRAVCRFMFFNPQDIDWFKPVELSTKKGLRGHILESLGTHGYMKCRFNGQLTSDDIICMHMYKRVYPKWHDAAWVPKQPEAIPVFTGDQ